MSILKRIPAAELGTKYTHLGWFVGLVPVYIGDVESDEPLVETRNWVPDAAFWLGLGLFEAFATVAGLLAPHATIPFPIVFTGRLDGKPLERPGS